MAGRASFPGAEGYGAEASGGRGGRVVKVTTSADDGRGSLRWALEDVEGPRIVVFEVNEVRLRHNIDLRDGDVTIAGQSAGGVAVSGATIAVRADNVIMRGMMFRPGDGAVGHDPGDRDALMIGARGASVRDVVIDHNSFMWATDENVSIYRDVEQVSFTDNIVAQGLYDSINPSGRAGMGLHLTSGGGDNEVPTRITIKDNLIAYNDTRNPWIKNGREVEFVNNFVFAPGDQDRAIDLGNTPSDGYSHALPLSVNVIANHYQAGPDTRDMADPPIRLRNMVESEYYIEGNLHLDAQGERIEQEYHGDRVQDLVSAPRFGSKLSIAPVEEVKPHVLANSGASPGARDAVEERLVDLVASGRGGIVDSVREAGGRGSRPAPKASADADGDGMPDSFEDAYDFDRTRDDANGDSDGDGYTNIEEYLNGLYTGFDLAGAKAPKPKAAEPTTAVADLSSAEPKSDLLVYLVDTQTDRQIAQVQDGDPINRSLLADRLVGISVAVAPQSDLADRVGSMALDLEDGLAPALENVAPYAVFGDNNGNYRDGMEFSPGSYTLAIEVFSGGGGSGALLEEVELTFLV